MIRFAVIADPHVHDCDWAPSGSGLASAIRSFGETGQSTRVFNESIPAFRAALVAAVEAGAKLVLLVGDLTDDGQRPNVDKALAILEEFRQQYGLRVLTTPGNHDFYALSGRDQRKTFLGADGTPVVVDSQDCPEAATLGTLEALESLSGLGFTPQDADLYWETPFGQNPAWNSRTYRVSSPLGRASCDMIDASYLVEPIEGLWVLSIDANVCVPRDDASDFSDPTHFLDPSRSGWNAVMRHRPHLLPWIGDVAKRARHLGKQLVAFSHYPPLDVLGNSAAQDMSIFGANGLAHRIPETALGEAFAATGVRLHFSGHLHVNDTARHVSSSGDFINVAVPSPVGYGAALKIVDLAHDVIHVRTLPLRDVPGHARAYAAYKTEATRRGEVLSPASKADDHGQFLDTHLEHLVQHRYLPLDWPPDMAAFVRRSAMSDLLELLDIDMPLSEDFSLLCFVGDWYRMRMAGELACADIDAERVVLYRRLAAFARPMPVPGLAARMTGLLDIMALYLNRSPNGDFTILPSMEIIAQPS
ncbi:metallophosphoesterase family protein [Devosia faecipullorum]|uniref:metallophosphoesterase family protein n=1 Tax=Devosia faecipullorum TaxID=2755039 RepID=UPI00187B9D01|nr:metallophosphoesterase [Devosia faecipullorum]MBE7731982.1 metallophosphoesterase [Devosia faecipullorum]